MSAASDRAMKLMAYADGELEGEELLEVERLLAADEDAARTIAQLGSLGDFVRLGHEVAVAPRLAKVDLTDAILSSIESEERKAGVEAAPPVISLDAGRRRRRIGAAVAGALALAASVFVMTRPETEKPVAHRPGAGVASAPTEESAVAAASGASGPGVEVDPAESPGQSVSVFYLPSANELSTSVVVWVDETGEK